MSALNTGNESAALISTPTRESKGLGWYVHAPEVEEAIYSLENTCQGMRRHSSFRNWLKWLWPVGILVFTQSLACSAELKPESIQGWDDYIKKSDFRERERLCSGKPFLRSDEIPGQTAKLRSGDVVATPAASHTPLRVPSGLIHAWNGAVFIQNATLKDVLGVLRNYERYKDFYRPSVVESRRLEATEAKDRFSLVLMNKSIVGTTALDSEYESTYFRLDGRRLYSVTDAIRIQEIARYGTSAQRSLPPDQGTGFIWRLHSTARYEERDGGVYVEVEAIALSRDIPSAMRWMVEPIVRRISRSSLLTSLRQTESAVRCSHWSS